jgi:hypothetical protein
MDDLDRARAAIWAADDTATGRIHEQLRSIEEGVFEEASGDKTQAEPGPKIDRLVELAEKLDALADEAEERATADRTLEARDYLRSYLKDHPQGG